MAIKVGDKVRIKTEEELLAEGWVGFRDIDGQCGLSEDDAGFKAVYYKQMGRIDKVIDLEDGDVRLGYDSCWVPESSVAEVIPQTLDEYICGLPLEERAKKFILIVPYVRPYTIEEIFYSTITVAKYNSYDEALLATIEALKQPKE